MQGICEKVDGRGVPISCIAADTQEEVLFAGHFYIHVFIEGMCVRVCLWVCVPVDNMYWDFTRQWDNPWVINWINEMKWKWTESHTESKQTNAYKIIVIADV